MNYEINLLHHVGGVAKRVCAAAAAETAAHKGDDNTPSGPTGRGVKSEQIAYCPLAWQGIIIIHIDRLYIGHLDPSN